ncbi:MAG: class I SAM-dependent DNA methyltransferase [Limisphaerales bacterium]
MMSKLALADGQTVLEPAAGDGAFVEALHETRLDLHICCLDKNPLAIKQLQDRFGDTVQTLCADTILSSLSGGSGLLARSGLPEKFDRVVGNPPYGGWLNYETRAALKKAFPDFHVRETYAMFILRCLELLKNDGVLSFIVPDTFLTVAAHRELREVLLKRTEILEIVTLPSKLFPGVAFGYSNLCIITIRKPWTRPDDNHEFCVIAVSSSDELESLARGEDAGSSVAVLQRKILQRLDSRIWTSGEEHVERMLHAAKLRLGDVADCKTGIYTGDNKRFIRAITGALVRGDYYESIPQTQVCCRPLSQSEMSNGLPTDPTWIPIVKGGSHRFVQKTSWVLDWSDSALSFYHNDAKARFQNSDFYFREGIGVPMVTSTRINAFLIQCRVFDQSVVGIFPKRQQWIFPLLVILNSRFATKLLKEGINPTANNSANYLKKLPLPKLTDSELRELGALGRLIARKRARSISTETEEQSADELVAAFYQRETSATTQDTWSDFAASDVDTPLFPCLREKPRSYRSKRPSRNP